MLKCISYSICVMTIIYFIITVQSRCAMVFGGVVSRDGLGLGCIGAPGYRAHRSVAMAPMFKGIRFGRHHFCSEVWEVVS